MKQALALEVLLSGNSALVTGPAGAGKTYLLTQFIKLAKHNGKKISVTATTGLAASHLGGTTIHSWSGIGIADELPPKFADHISKSRREIIEKTDVLIIDEISMLHDYRLDMVDEACRQVKKQPDVPFGGIQLVMSGDFFQLPPINRGDNRGGGFVVHSQAWRELEPIVCYLEEQHRQEDSVLSEILNAMRAKDVRQRHAKPLLDRTEARPPEGSLFTELHTVNVDVDSQNKARLKELEGEEISYQQTTTGSDNYVENLQRSVLAPSVLDLKQGALVMSVKNSAEKKYYNGSLGTVTGFEPGTEYPIVTFANNREVTMQPDTWELRDGDKKRASITQIPLRLAWAITVHKSQGMTLDSALIDLRKAFVPGMGYVALSRVRSLDTLYLKGINRTALQMSEDAFNIDEQLRAKSSADSKKYAKLLEKAPSRDIRNVKPDTNSSSWSEKIAAMRLQHPNAYRPWTAEADEQLKQNFQNGHSIKKLSAALGRHEGSVTMRLKKHFGEDVVG